MTRRFAVSGDTCHLAAIRARAREFFVGAGFEECAAEVMVLALDEACTNVIRHAYGNECGPLRLTFARTPGGVRVTLRDYGKRCDPGKIRGRDLDDVRPGGLGVHIIRQAFDRVDYVPRPRGTRLVLEKGLPPAGPG